MSDLKKYDVYSSHLALRFYKSCGWTDDLLKSCLEKGTIVLQENPMGDDYWILAVGASFNTSKLLRHVAKIIDFEGKPVRKAEIEKYTIELNW